MMVEKTFRIAERCLADYHIQVLKGGDCFSLYRFELARYGQADCKRDHFFSHRHPEANFVNHMVVSLIGENETRSLVDLKYWIILQSSIRNQDISSPEELDRILVGELGFQVTESESSQPYEKLIICQEIIYLENPYGDPH